MLARFTAKETLVTRVLSLLILATALACSGGSSDGTGAGASAGASAGSGKFEVTHLKEGTGRSPTATSSVIVHYSGTLTDGTVFDSSIERGEPIAFPLDRVIPCWTQGLQQMKAGGKAKLVCPPEMAYGAEGRPGTIPPNSTLLFEVELLEVQ